MASVVWTSEDEPTLLVAKFVAELAWADAGEEVAGPAVAQNVSEAGTLLASNRIVDLVSLLLTASDIVFARASDKDVDGVVSVVVNLVAKAVAAGSVSSVQTQAMTELITSKLAAAPADKAPLKLKLLFLLHNVLPPAHAARYTVLLNAVRVAAEARLADVLLPNLRRLDLPRQEWWANVSSSDRQQLYLELANLLKDGKSKAAKEAASAYRLAYLSLFTAEDVAAAAASGGLPVPVREAAAQAAIEFIRSPDAFQSELLDLPAVQQLQHDNEANHRLLHSLLLIFLTQRLPQYTVFRAANPAVFSALGLVHEECEAKMRLLSLAALASDSLSAVSSAAAAAAAGVTATPSDVGEIRYSLVQETLQVDEKDVEAWVVRGIVSKLIDAKMDQMRRVVIVSRATQRVFGPVQWHELRSRLIMWKENVTSVSRLAHQAQAQGGGTPAAAAAAAAGPAAAAGTQSVAAA